MEGNDGGGAPAADDVFAPPEPDAELVERARERGWPDGLMADVARIRVDRGVVEQWLDTGFPDAEGVAGYVAMMNRLMEGTLHSRIATWADTDLLIDLFAHSPERVGEWQVIVDRSPNPYAQYHLQEHAYLNLLEDRRVGLGVTAHSTRNTVIAGIETSCHIMGSWRVREGFRGQGLSQLLQWSPGVPQAFGLVTYWYVRADNADLSWINKVVDDMEARPDELSQGTQGLSATVHHLDVSAPGPAHDGLTIRPTELADLPACGEIIDATHVGQDLTRPMSADVLRRRLDDDGWGPRPEFIPSVYGWPDHRVVVDDATGAIVACGGLWDRGRDIRERWRHADGTERVVDPTALLDCGHADGRPDALAALIDHFADVSGQLGRSSLMAPLEFLPDVRAALAHRSPRPETRLLHVMPFQFPGIDVGDLTVSRPHTDLRYW